MFPLRHYPCIKCGFYEDVYMLNINLSILPCIVYLKLVSYLVFFFPPGLLHMKASRRGRPTSPSLLPGVEVAAIRVHPLRSPGVTRTRRTLVVGVPHPPPHTRRPLHILFIPEGAATFMRPQTMSTGTPTSR